VTVSQEQKANNSQTINIEIPSRWLEGMFGMMERFRKQDKAGTGCCDISQENCCPLPEENAGREFNIVIKMKE
jgi:hypothetical protein